MGSLFSAPKAPPPPPPPPPVTIRDEIGGVEQVPVRNENGDITYVTRKIPLTAEQKAEQQRLEGIMSDALAEIEKLSQSDYNPDARTQEVLAEWEAQRKELLSDDFERRSSQEDTLLARRGLADSSAGQSVRRQRQLDKQKALTQLGREKLSLEDNIRQEQLGLQQNLYNIAATRNNADEAQALQSAARSQSQFIGANQARQATIMQYYNQQLQASQQPSLFSNLLPSFGLAAGTALGGGAVGLGGSLIGSLFNKGGRI